MRISLNVGAALRSGWSAAARQTVDSVSADLLHRWPGQWRYSILMPGTTVLIAVNWATDLEFLCRLFKQDQGFAGDGRNTAA